MRDVTRRHKRHRENAKPAKHAGRTPTPVEAAVEMYRMEHMILDRWKHQVRRHVTDEPLNGEFFKKLIALMESQLEVLANVTHNESLASIRELDAIRSRKQTI